MIEDGAVRPEGCICEPCSDIPTLSEIYKVPHPLCIFNNVVLGHTLYITQSKE